MNQLRHACLALACLALATIASAEVRPISEAERAGVQMASDYLARGPQALVERLSARSPLRKLPASVVSNEIAARLGPAAGATWRLATVVDALQDRCAAFSVSYPSGIDDTVVLDVVKEGAEYRLADIRIMAMPSRRPPLFAAASRPSDTKTDAFRIDTAVSVAGLVALALALIAAWVMGAQTTLGRILYLIAIVAGAGTMVAAMLFGERLRVAREQPLSTGPAELSLAPLAEVRRALAAGGSNVGVALTAARTDGAREDVVRLWKVQWDFQQMKLAEAKRTLDTFPVPSNIPLVEVMRARMALIENDPSSALVSYQRAITAGPGCDSLWIEASEALLQGGFGERAQAHLTRLVDLGTREPSVYYARAAAAQRADDLMQELEHAWKLYPVERADLVGSDLLFPLLRKRGSTFIDLSQPREASFASPQTGSRALALAPEWTPRVSGDYLHLKMGDVELSVPGGAVLAPAGAQVVSADEWSRLAQVDALADVAALIASSPSAASYMQPALRERMTRSANALAERSRWTEVVTLTNGITPKAEFVPMDLFFLRAHALQRTGRNEEAKQLLLEVAASPVVERRRNALDFEQLGDMLGSYDQFDRAGEMFDKARRIRPSGYDDVRLAQLGMDKRLASEYSTLPTEHFEIHYPRELPSGFVRELAVVLEGELQRLQKTIPVPDFKRVTVNVVWWQEFTKVYTGSEDILGFYNGKITVPLAGVVDYEPEVVALVTHELAHAMVAQVTNSQAPHWFQEGVAQHMEMVEYSANPFNMYEDSKLLAMPVLEPVLTTSRDSDLIGAAYIMSETLIRFIEQRYGAVALQKFMAQYAASASTDEAVRAVTGLSVPEFESAFRAWGHAEQRIFENTIVVRYDRDRSITVGGAPPQGSSLRGGSLTGGTFYPMPLGGHQ